MFTLSHATDDGTIQVYWEGGFNGGHTQIFILQYRLVTQQQWTDIVNITEGNSFYKLANGSYSVNATGLSPGTYEIRLYAVNVKGSSGIKGFI